MTKFNPAMLVAAAQVEGFGKPATQRTVQQVALANIAKMKAQFANPDEEGKRNFEVKGNMVKFTVRVSNQALTLGQYDSGGVTADIKEAAVPKTAFLEALDYIADQLKAGEMDAQLTALQTKREGRTAKMKATRAAKPKSDKKPA